MRRLLALVLVAFAWAAPTARASLTVPDPPLTNADYFTFADRVTEQMEQFWSPTKHYYSTGARSIDTICTAAMLTVFATANAYGHIGPARNDERARELVERLTQSPPYYTAKHSPHYDKMFHSPGWTSNMDGPYVDMDKSIDPKVAEALQMAYRTRDKLGLSPADATRIQTEIKAVAYTKFFRYPKVRLNQINWHAELYAYNYLVNGDPTLLRDDYYKHVNAFTQGFSHTQIPGGAPNVGPSYRFTYQNNAPESYGRNLDSAEYANMTLHFIYWYDLARKAGMQQLPAEDFRRLRAWTQRVLFGYWTHSGFMNWDTGWSYERWMKGKAWAYAQQGLIAIAASPEFQMRKDEGPWAKYIFDRGLRLYEHLSYQKGSHGPFLPSAQLYHIGVQGTPASTMFWARTAANATRAVSAGMGTMQAKEPPPFYSYDADIGRLAVSTPHYSTAILAVNRGIVPYGGIDLARFYDADGDPIGGTGGHPPAAFGVQVVRKDGRRLYASQEPLRHDPPTPPLILTHSPHGAVTHQRVLATHPDAGPFHTLSEYGVRSARGISVTSAYTFRERSISAAWTIRRPMAMAKVSPRVTLPTWGRVTRIVATLTSGRHVRIVKGVHLNLRKVRDFYLRGEYGAYHVTIPAGTRGRTALYAAHRQKADPRGGPTLALALPALKTGTRHLAVSIVPSASGGMVADPEDGPGTPYPVAR